MASASCIMCKIIKGDIPCHKILETTKTLSFLDINPLSRGHALVIPKEHAEVATDLSDDSLYDIGPAIKKVAKAIGCQQWNLLQNNGRLAHQEVMHVHYHIIPKPDVDSGLKMDWSSTEIEKTDMKLIADSIRANIKN